MKFDIPTATKLGLEKYKLWNYIKNNQKVLLAATVDGGQLAWKLTQISAGIKIVDEKSINPRTAKAYLVRWEMRICSKAITAIYYRFLLPRIIKISIILISLLFLPK